MLGGLHYRTFDGKRYSFRGSCQYILVQVRLGWALVVEVHDSNPTIALVALRRNFLEGGREG